MSRRSENTGFMCAHCGKHVAALNNGSYRNHCPFCLYSLHVDARMGDRQSECRGLMRPAGLRYSSKKGYQIVHVCCKCGATRANRVAVGTDMPDDFEVVLGLIK